MARAAKSSSVPRDTKSSGRQVVGRKKEALYNSPKPEDDPYSDMRIPDNENNDPANDEYIWPEYEDEDEDRV